ncbi:RING/U-box superfamily protein [Trifolium repens]|nr:RING/U-box superfamily protein [Trifolium repens]
MENRQRITLYDQMISGNTSNNNTRISLASLIQNEAVLTNQKTPNPTLLDIIRENEPNNVVNVNNNRKSWKGFKELLRLKRRNSDESTQQQPQQNDIVHEDVVNSDLTELLAGGESYDEEINVNNSETAQVSMSLMDLLEESEIELDRSSYVDDEGDDDDVDENHEEEKEEEREEGGGEGNVKVEHNCCVCMVRHKGAAFIPCGHTFCRMCSRELWVSRGNCPLCNHFILEVLDIF